MALKALFDEPLMWRAVGACAFILYDASEWQWQHYVIWTLFIIAAMELLARLVMAFGWVFGYSAKDVAIPRRGVPLDQLASIDVIFITINKLLTALFSYHMVKYVWYSPNVRWQWADVSVWNTAVALVALYVLYDLGYAIFHRTLHLRSVYALVHKHHHRQTAPFRGNVDAINVHPFEFVVGEYNHLLVIHAIALAFQYLAGSSELAVGIHVGTIAFFIAFGGILASLNHTRFDVNINIPFLGPAYSVKYHDLHHWSPNWNYGQYTMLWDVVMGTFRAYPTGAPPVISSTRSKVPVPGVAEGEECATLAADEVKQLKTM